MQNNSWIQVKPFPEETIKFEVYTNYLRGLAYFLKKRYKSYSKIGESIVYKNNKDKIDTSLIEKYLHNAWNSERILNSPKELNVKTSFIKFANHWSPVLGYYSIFLCFQALLISLGEKPILEHANFLSKVSSFIKKNNLPFIYPWNLLCWSCTYYNEEKFNYEVDSNKVRDLNILENPRFVKEPIFIAKILKTTRIKEEIYREKKWKKDGKIKNKDGSVKKRFTREEKEKVSNSVSPTSIFNFLYRLRIRSNYEDADIFFVGERSDKTVNDYFNSIILITDYTMFFIESVLKQIIGKKEFLSLVKTFVNSSTGYNFGIVPRERQH